jgi:enoyl-CoA hydratase
VTDMERTDAAQPGAVPPEAARIRVEYPVPAGLPGAPASETETAAPPITGVALLTIDRPRVLNAIDDETMRQLVDALERLDADPDCRCIVITGAGERAFAAGADIAEMADETPESLAASGRFERWDRIAAVRTPIVAAVRGYALGGGCELALACDMIVAADDAVFGQPEVKLGVIPGAGGTQRLARALGKARAMELILTGRQLPARDADAHGLISRLVPPERVLPEALELAAVVASMPPLAVQAAAEAIDLAAELPLAAGIQAERRAFHELFASQDQKEGMHAFLEKRRPAWRGK